MTQNTDIKQPIFTKALQLISQSIFRLFMYVSFIIIIADYSKSTYHASDSLAGLVVGLFIIGSLIGRFGTGKYVNKFGPKNINYWIIIACDYTITLLHSWINHILNVRTSN